MKLYECEVTISRGYIDGDGYPSSRETTEILSYHSLERLYKELANLKKLERPKDNFGDSVTVYFENIREMQVISESEVDLNVLHETEVWKKFQKDLEEKKKRDAERLVREAEELERIKEEKEKEELKRLMEKYGK
jgi:hypothetical protein